MEHSSVALNEDDAFDKHRQVMWGYIYDGDSIESLNYYFYEQGLISVDSSDAGKATYEMLQRIWI